jgi:hypothetical protein
MAATMKRRHIPHIPEKQQHEYAAVVDNDFINDDDLKAKTHRYQPQPQPTIVYSSNKVKLNSERIRIKTYIVFRTLRSCKRISIL